MTRLLGQLQDPESSCCSSSDWFPWVDEALYSGVNGWLSSALRLISRIEAPRWLTFLTDDGPCGVDMCWRSPLRVRGG